MIGFEGTLEPYMKTSSKFLDGMKVLHQMKITNNYYNITIPFDWQDLQTSKYEVAGLRENMASLEAKVLDSDGYLQKKMRTLEARLRGKFNLSQLTKLRSMKFRNFVY